MRNPSVIEPKLLDPNGPFPDTAPKKPTLEERRADLFETGSHFMPIQRNQIIGIDNVLVEIEDIIHWLKNSQDYTKHNSRLEPGVIFEGNPGVGKTMVSRWIATESEATFINVRDFEYDGSLIRSSDIADLFKRARQKYAETKKPVILFWDEFEGVAINRDEGTPEQIATVSQITTELDGIHGKNEGILLVGCTNYIFGIDDALQRPGRMGLHIEFNAPDREGKKLILAHYLHDYEVKDMDIETLSYFFDSDSTAAHIEEACVEAWRFAVRRSLEEKSDPVLTEGDLVKVFLKRLVGPPTSFINLPEEERHHIAVHECGHAIMACVFNIPLRLITIHPGKDSLGKVMTIEIQEHTSTHDELLSEMRCQVGSMVAEKTAGLPLITGSSGDIQHISMTAHYLVETQSAGERLGIFNPDSLASERKGDHHTMSPNVSTTTLEDADKDIRDLIESVEKDATEVLGAIGSDNIHAIADVLCEKVTMTGAQFEAELAKVLGTDDFSVFRP